MKKHLIYVLSLSLFIFFASGCIGDGDTDGDASTESEVTSTDVGDAGDDVGDAGDDVGTVDCTDSDSCSCTDFHGDPDTCEDSGCKPWTLTEYDVDKIFDEINESDKTCEDVEGRVLEQYDFCLKEHWISPDGTNAVYSHYNEDDDAWEVYASQNILALPAREELGLVKCGQTGDEDVEKVCWDCASS